MKKSILNLSGVTELTKDQQKSIVGGNAQSIGCIDHMNPCPGGISDCNIAKNQGCYLEISGEAFCRCNPL